MSLVVGALCGLLLLGSAQGEPDSVPVVSKRLTDRETSKRAGVFGLGLGVELPATGLVLLGGSTTGFGTGYHLGGALLWEFRDRFALRLYGAGGEAYGARVWLQYQEAGELVRSEQEANWLGAEGGAGLVYLARGYFPSFVPFLGLEGGPLLHGYFYRFDPTLEKVEGVDPDSGRKQFEHRSVHLDYKVNLRLGVRMEVLAWLASSVEASLSYSTIGEASLTGTLAAREVKTEAGGVWTLGLLYSVYLGL